MVEAVPKARISHPRLHYQEVLDVENGLYYLPALSVCPSSMLRLQQSSLSSQERDLIFGAAISDGFNLLQNFLGVFLPLADSATAVWSVSVKPVFRS